MRSGSRLLVAVCALLACASQAPAEELLPRPEGLEPNVRFWERVYSEVGREGGLIHDSEHLDVVYQKLVLPAGLSERERERRIEAAKQRIRGDLRVLAQGRRTGLTADQADILALWPVGVTDATLQRATGNVRFQLGQADKFREGLVRSGAWMDHIQRSLRDHGVPPELAALPHVESSFNPKAYSRVGAAGLWQFTRSTGRLFLRIDSVVDERLDPFKATDAAARLLVKNYQITGTWPLAVTSYNHGAAGMRRASKTLGTTDIVTIVRKYTSRTFGFASRNFYASFLAALAVDRRAVEIFGDIHPHRPVDYTVIELPHYYRASSLAEALGLDWKTLQEHNNALRPAVWEDHKLVPGGYLLRVPSAALAAPPEQLLANVPDSERFAMQHRDRYHTVHRGETLSIIARRYGVSESELVALNHLRSRHRIRVGQVITLPGGADVPIAVARQPLPDDGIYTVRRGDNLTIIGRRFGVSEAALADANALASRHRIQVGQRLVIPGAAPVVVASAQAAEPPAAQPVSYPAPPPQAAPVQQPAPAPVVAETPPAPVPQVVAVAPAVEPEPVLEPETEIEPGREAGPALEGEPAVEPDPAAETEAEIEPEPEIEPADEPALAIELAVAPEIDPEAVPEPEPSAILAAQPPSGPPDPSDYAVHDDRVTVQAEETLGHYAEWLEVSASRLRQANRMRYGQPLVIGRRVRLDFSRVTPEEFERQRLEYHRTLQEDFFSAYEITGTERHVLERGETLWYLAERKFQIPIWLLRQYNPELDFGSLPTGVEMTVPVVSARAGGG